MNDHIPPKSKTLIIVIAACIILPSIDNFFGSAIWGGNWISPAFMDQLNGYLIVAKLILIGFAICLLIVKHKVISRSIENVIVRRTFTITAFILALVQIPVLCLLIMVNGVSPSNLDDIHKEKNFKNRSIYVYTADPGAMGTAYHYFYLKCPLPLNRYKLKLITRTHWMAKFSFDVVDNELFIEDKSKEGATQKVDITGFKCD